MQRGVVPSGSSGSAAAAVVRAARTHLAGLDPGRPDDLAALLAVTDDLLHRAALDDAVRSRRAELLPAGTDPAEHAAALSGDELRAFVVALRDCELGGLPPQDRLDLPAPGSTPATSAAALADYLRSRGEDRALVSAAPVAGGFSKETILLTLDGTNGTEEVVLRKVAAGRVADSLAREFDVLRFVAGHGLTVARPLWLDPDGATLGGPLFATTRMPGRTVGTVSGPDDGATPAVARELASLLGRLHALDVTGLASTPRPAMVADAELLAAVDEREKIVRQAADALPDTPGLALHHVLLSWLRENMPTPRTAAVLVHGDVGFHNLLVDHGRVSALLDWELSHRGRPAEDLAYVRPSVESLLPWEEFLDVYLGAGGVPVDLEELRFFTVWQDVWRAVSCLRLRTKFVLDPVRLSDGVSGLLLGTRFLDSALETAFGGTA